MDIHCVVQDESDKWLLVEEIDEFHFNGFAIISKASIERRRYNRLDKTLEQILRQEGAKPSVSSFSLAGNYREVFTRLSKLDTLITVESEDESRFLIGSIHRVASDRLFMKHFPVDGKWFNRPIGIDYSEIGRVGFFDEYGRGWHRYHKEANKAKMDKPH